MVTTPVVFTGVSELTTGQVNARSASPVIPKASWDKELLRNSRSRIKKIFKTYYNSSSNTFDDDIEEMTSIDPVKIALEAFKSKLKPRLGETFLPWWRKNRLRTNPFDSKGKLCEK